MTRRSTSSVCRARDRPGRRGRRPCGPPDARRRQAPLALAAVDGVAELAEQRVELVAAAVHVADDVERAVLVPPVVPERLALDRRPPRPPPASRARRRGGSPRAAGRAASGASCWLCWRMTCGPKSRSGRVAVALLAEPSPAGRRRSRPASSGTRAPARPAACAPPAARSSRRRRSAGRRPAACAAMKCSTSKASSVAAWSFSSSRDEAAAEVGREDLGRLEVLAREGRLAGARRADQHDERQLRNRAIRSMLSLLEDRHLRRRARARIVRPDGQEAHGVAEARRRHALGPRLELGARPLEAVVAVAEAVPAGKPLEVHVVLGVRRRQRRPCRAARTRTARARTRASRGGSRCSITSTTAAASKPARRWSR